MRGYGGMGQMGQMMKQAQMMQMNLQKVQKELENIDVTGESGSGAVKVVLTCKYLCKKVEIDESLIGQDADKDMLEDLVLTAINDACKKVEAESNKRISAATGGIKLPF